jgi:hypothetical protein
MKFYIAKKPTDAFVINNKNSQYVMENKYTTINSYDMLKNYFKDENVINKNFSEEIISELKTGNINIVLFDTDKTVINSNEFYLFDESTVIKPQEITI